jgi:hypothetical protein
MYSANRDSHTILSSYLILSYPIPVRILLFLLPVLLLWLGIQILCGKRMESGHFCPVPDFRGNGFNFSPLSIKLPIGLVIPNL